MASQRAVKEIFLRTLMALTGKQEGVAFRELEAHFGKYHRKKPATIMRWLGELTDNITLKDGRVIVHRTAHIDPVQPRRNISTKA